MDNVRIVKKLLKIARALVAIEDYNVLNIEKKDWDRARALIDKDKSAAESMRKLTKDHRKLWARAACLYAIAEQVEEMEEKIRTYNRIVEDNRKTMPNLSRISNYYDYSHNIKDMAEILLKETPNLVRSAQVVKLNQIPFARDFVNKNNAIIVELNEKIDALKKLQEQNRNKKQALEKQLENKLKEIGNKCKSARKLSLTFIDGSWYFVGEHNKRKFNGMSYNSFYWELSYWADTSQFTDRYDFSTPSEINVFRCGVGENSLYESMRNNRIKGRTYRISKIPNNLYSEYVSIKREFDKL